MPIALRSYASAGAVMGVALIAITPAVTPDTAQRGFARASTAEPVVLSSFSQDIQDIGAILAGLIDPDLTGAPAQAADTAATADLGTGFSTALSDANNAMSGDAGQLSFAETNPTDYFADMNNDGDVAQNAGVAVIAADTAATDAAQAAAALSAADPIQVFQDDLQTDWSQLLSDPLSSTMLTDLIATLDAAPAAAQEEIALLLDPAAAGQVSAYEEANGAAEAAVTAQQQYEATAAAATTAETAAAAAQASGGDPTDIATVVSENSAALTDLTAAATANGDSATYATDALNTLAGLSPESVSTELATLWTDLQSLF